MDNEKMNSELYSMMQSGVPLRTYKKTIVGKVFCTVLNPFSNEPEGILLFGDPKSEDASTMVDVWTNAQDVFFRRSNKRAIETGMLREYKRVEVTKDINPEPFAVATDDEIDAALSGKYYSILKSLNQCTTEAVLLRFLDRARSLEKSEKIIKVIEGRISELQSGMVFPDGTSYEK